MSDLSKLEGILFAFGDEGVSKTQLLNAFSCSVEVLNDLIARYQKALQQEERGLELMIYDEFYKLVTKAEHHEIIQAMLSYNRTRNLSQAALETLAIIAYRQPITRLEIEEIRGVNSDMMCRRLEALDLIKESGRADSIGRPILYEVTPSFLDIFKLATLAELPEIKLESMEDNRGLFEG